MTKKFPVVATIVCCLGVMILCALGVWQLQRLQWKNDLQHNLDIAFSTPHPDDFTPDQFTHIGKGNIIRGTVNGQLDVSKAITVFGRIQNGKSVVAVVAPLTLPSPDKISIPVEIGCGDAKTIGTLPILKPKYVSLTGVLRQPVWSFATPPNIPKKEEWWRIDTQELASYWGLKNLQNAVITAEDQLDFGYPAWPSLSPCPIEKTLRNDHLSYAIFWFSMAGVLVIMWGLRFLRPYLQSA